MLQPQQSPTYPGLLEACRSHIAKIQRWRRGNNVYTFISIEGSYSFDWTLQLISNDEARFVLDLALSRPDHIEAFRAMKTFARWQVTKEEPADFQATLAIPIDADRCEKYISVLLHKILGVAYGTPLLAELSETLPPATPEQAVEAAPSLPSPTPKQEESPSAPLVTPEAQPEPQAAPPSTSVLPQSEYAASQIPLGSPEGVTPEPAPAVQSQDTIPAQSAGYSSQTIHKVPPKSSSLPIILGIIIGAIMLIFGFLIILAMLSDL